MGEDSDGSAATGEQRPAVLERPRRWEHARLVVAVVLGLWLAWAAVAVWSTPRHALPADLRAAVTAHRIVQHQMSAQPIGRLQLLVARTGASYYSSDDDVVVWTERGGRQFWIAPEEMADLGVRLWYPPGTDESAVPLKRAERNGAAVWMEQHAGRVQASTPRADVVRQVAWLGSLLGLLLLVRRPATGTRWFWFWVFGIPFAFGVAWYCWVEVLAHGQPRERRRTGWWGFVVAFLLNSVLTTLANLVP